MLSQSAGILGWNGDHNLPDSTTAGEGAVLKRLPRDPIRFDVFGAFAGFGREERVSLRTAEGVEGFLTRIRETVAKNLASPSFLHGQRTEAMFEALVASLGKVQLLRQEDAGSIYAVDDTLRVPDFHLVLMDGSRILVEVKNVHQSNPSQPLILRADYLNGLRKYADLIGCPVKLAVYWVGWNRWTLTPPSAFLRKGEREVLTFSSAVTVNEMAALGDVMVGTRPPLHIRLLADPSKPRSLKENGQVEFVIGDVEIYSGDRQVTGPREQNLAWYLILFGEWQEDGPTALFAEGQLAGVEYEIAPEEDQGMGFEIIGTLSRMFSSYYLQSTSDDSGVNQTLATFTPGKLGELIPEDCKGDALPLWCFVQQPATLSDEES